MVQRRKFSAEFKTKVVLELIAGKKSLSEASHEYQIKDSVLSRWKQEFLERASEIFTEPQPDSEKDVRIAELERMVGKLSMQMEVQKKAASYASLLHGSSEWW
jgi:transposase